MNIRTHFKKSKLEESIPTPEKRFNSAVHELLPKLPDELSPQFQDYDIHHVVQKNNLDSIVFIPRGFEDNIHNFIHNRIRGYKTKLTLEQFRQKYQDAKVYTVQINPEWHDLSLIKFLEDQKIL